MKLSVLIPVYNEELLLSQIVQKVIVQNVKGLSSKELIIVDDGSTDGSRGVIERLAQEYPDIIRPFFQPKNMGKGRAIATALSHMTGEICIVQDADLEYDPKDYELMLEPIINDVADCVYGSRFKGSSAKRVLYVWHYFGNRFLTLLSNVFTQLNLSDMETCYKAFRTSVLEGIDIKSNDFGFEPEITAKIARKKCRIYEVGISYYGRNYFEGKKITWRDGLKAIWYILRFAFTD